MRYYRFLKLMTEYAIISLVWIGIFYAIITLWNFVLYAIIIIAVFGITSKAWEASNE